MTIVCLANSYKHGGRCVAGICVDTGEWIRLRSAADEGALTPREYALPDGAGEPRLQDLLEVELHYAMPTDCHPEDWVVAPARWKLLNRPCSAKLWDQVSRYAEIGTSVLGGYRDRLAAKELIKRPMKASLSIFMPDEVWWWVKEVRGERKNRALFKRNHVTFNLPVTDPVWIAQMNLLPTGIYPHAMFAPNAKHTWLIVSFSEAFKAYESAEAWHYRLVAGVVCR